MQSKYTIRCEIIDGVKFWLVDGEKCGILFQNVCTIVDPDNVNPLIYFKQPFGLNGAAEIIKLVRDLKNKK